MNDLEKLLEKIAADLVMVSLDDLPALAGLHEELLHLGMAIKDDKSVAARAARKTSELIEKIILNEASDKNHSLTVLNDAIVGLQGLIRDNRAPSEVIFPKEFELTEAVPKEKSVTETGGESMSKSTIENADQKPRDSENNRDSQKNETNGESLFIDLSTGDNSLVADFISEAREHCTTAEQMLMDLETNPDNQAAINAIFRSFHTIKGAAGFLDLKPILVLAHESETLLDLGRKGTIVIAGKVADTTFDSIDILRKLLIATEDCLKSGNRYDGSAITMPLLNKLKALIENPEAATIEEPQRVGDILIDMGAVSQNEIDEALTKKEKSNEKLGETLVKQGLVSAKVIAHALRDQQQVRNDKPTVSTVKEMVKIDTERLDRLVDTIGELVIAESMVGQDEEILGIVSPKIARNISHLNKITRELQEMGMAMRLVPVRPTFQKLARAVRDLTKKAGKEVEFETIGEDTEVDRSIVENIGDPLMHMIRNSVDHGIESAEEREKAGKNRTGRVTVRAYHKGGKIYFDIEDDGKGLDREKILAKAREKGLIDANKELTEKEIFALIFLPGFSTAAKVTDISGRGVGMDVVRKNIEVLRGQVEITSQPGQGSKFSMRLPLTLAIIDGMLVSVEEEKFIIPTLSIVESLSLTQEMISTIRGRAEMIDLRGDLLPLVRVNEIFALKGANENHNEKTVVVVEDGIKRVGLVVDKLLGQRQTVIKSLGPIFGDQKWVAGGAILSDGNVGLIIDVGGVVSLAGQSQSTPRMNKIECDQKEEKIDLPGVQAEVVADLVG
jgi:two-component system, chemotaxis family, sensor kinase CheA